MKGFENLQGGVYKNQTSANKGEGEGPNFGHFVRT